MERKTQAPLLIDAVIHDIGDPRMTAKLDQLDKAVPWDQLAAPIQATYGNSSDAGGRPNILVTMMLKVMMLQKWHNLGDAALEGMLRDPRGRISFRRFVGIGLSDEVIDETSVVRFRNRLREHGLSSGTKPEALTELMKPCPAELMMSNPVSTFVNSSRNNDERCVQPVEPAPKESGLFEE